MQLSAHQAKHGEVRKPIATTVVSAPVNAHYLDRVLATAQSHEVAASRDIVAGNGVKLLAKGARIDAGVRARLLEHKLRRPLEDCVQVVDGVTGARLEAAGDSLLAMHPLLRAVCSTELAPGAPAALAALPLSMPLLSLLSVYASSEGRLNHAVGVGMLALSLARKLVPGDIDRHRLLATAGLVHDVGELYLDPVFLKKGTRLDPEKWRHIVTHPLVGHLVLKGMQGVSPVVADAVLLHHERLDGFGYPRGVIGDAFTLDGQIVAAAEWLMALIESDSSPLTKARMADRLVPGEFSPEVLAAISAATREAPDVSLEQSSFPPLADVVPRIVRLADTLRRFDDSRAWIDERILGAGPALRSVLQTGLQRTLRIQASFSSTGLAAHNAEQLLCDSAALEDPHVHAEITTLVSELEWRMRELERNQRLRASVLPVPERAVIEDLIGRLKEARE